MIKLSYEKGTIVVKSNFKLPHTVWDNRVGCFRCLPMFYTDLIDYLKLSNLDYEDNVQDLMPMQNLTCNLTLHDYQKDALNKWLQTRNGVLVLPTGAGKTIIGLKAISVLNVPALVVVPTLELVQQWKKELENKFGIEVGTYSGEGHLLKPITVSTYDTAYLRAEELGNRFLLLIFDEVHHLPSPGYANIAELFIAPYRLGLTATYEREDGLHKELERLIGGKVYEIGIDKLSGKHLAEYETRKIVTDLTAEERAEYEKYHAIFTDFLKKKKIILKSPTDFRLLVMRSGRDAKAREALLARNRARGIALNSESKLNALSEILNNHFGKRMIIFTEHNSLVYAISKEFLIPAITHTTHKEERAEILNNFREGKYKVVVTSKVLEEGIDVPEASVGVILSGTGSKREYKQRLGRILRKKEGKLAILYEIVSKRTTEMGIARRRKGTEAKTSE
ncbi:MAG: DEAD/DEAH box helicase family protein [Candidatus Syntrophoarchaeum sp.]|nr:DEAD/DEAH box helicase family protein [Candidatus Syntrophoarchaeum sp.]